jgi:hypothetical protein
MLAVIIQPSFDLQALIATIEATSSILDCLELVK